VAGLDPLQPLTIGRFAAAQILITKLCLCEHDAKSPLLKYRNNCQRNFFDFWRRATTLQPSLQRSGLPYEDAPIDRGSGITIAFTSFALTTNHHFQLAFKIFDEPSPVLSQRVAGGDAASCMESQ
jgi:hypothetical protein